MATAKQHRLMTLQARERQRKTLDTRVMMEAPRITAAMLLRQLEAIPPDTPIFYSEGAGGLHGWPATQVLMIPATPDDDTHAERPNRIVIR